MVITRQARATYGQTCIISPFGLCKHPRCVVQHVFDGGGLSVTPGALGHQSHAARDLFNGLLSALQVWNGQTFTTLWSDDDGSQCWRLCMSKAGPGAGNQQGQSQDAASCAW